MNVRAVERAIDILVAVGERDMRLIDLSARVGLHKASVARLAETLVTSGMLARDEHLNYSLGPQMILLAGQLLSRYRRAADLLREPLQRLWNATRETVTVHVRVDLECLCVAELPTPQPIGYRAGPGTRAPLHAGATSKVLLAFLPDAERNDILARLTLVPITSRTVTSVEVLRAQLDEIRRQGFAVSTSEYIVGGSAASVPVFDLTGVAGAVSIHGPESRLTEPTLNEYGALLMREIRPLGVVVSDG
ncbi:MAG: IclR family transcriptional regulator [Candidatus Rokubacteria bacterium]|nr:IclR family transcriptional regulator [Candidatus Rokubacteria bacterium]